MTPMHVNAQPLLGAGNESVGAVAPAPSSSEQELQRLTQAAVKFEAFFVAQMMEQMRKSTAVLADEDSALNDHVNQAPLAMADHAVADALSERRAFGIADMLVRQMSASWTAAAPHGEPTPTRNMA